jgi:hypothetical protein
MGERDRNRMIVSVQNRVKEISEEKGINQTEATIILYEQYLAGETEFVDPNPPRRLIDYLFSIYSAWYWLVILGLSLMIASIYVFPQIPPFTWLRVALGFVTSLYLPGYTFIEALYPKKDELEELERFGLSVGLSIALTPLVGFVLNYTPWGIRLDPITVMITALTAFFGIFGVIRKYQYHLLSLELREQHG